MTAGIGHLADGVLTVFGNCSSRTDSPRDGRDA